MTSEEKDCLDYSSQIEASNKYPTFLLDYTRLVTLGIDIQYYYKSSQIKKKTTYLAQVQAVAIQIVWTCAFQ